MKKVIVAIMAALSVGCTGVTTEASRVMLHDSNSNFLDNCQRLGPVTGVGSGFKPRLDMDSWKGVAVDAQNDMREKAYSQYGADSVVLINMDKTLTEIIAHGIAYRCNK